MTKWAVVYTKRNSFFGKSHDILEEIDGRKTVVGKYNKPTAPGALRIYKPQFKRKPSNKFQIDMSQAEVNSLVTQIGFLDSKGDLIKEANLQNASDKFFTHNDLYLRIEGGVALLDDEIPFDKFFIACLRADPKFQFSDGTKNPAMSALVEYKVTMAGDIEDEESQEISDGVKAIELLLSMSFEKQVKTLNAMGVRTSDPDPERVKSLLSRKILKEGDEINSITGETNTNLFIRLASSSTEELSLRSIIGEARKARVIGKKSGGKFVFGDLEIGRNLEEVYNYLSSDDNIDIKNDIIKSLKDNGKSTN